MTLEMHIEAEFSRLISPDSVGSTDLSREIEAEAGERQALAERFDLLSLDRLTARLTLHRDESAQLIVVTGTFEAEATQSCVVSLAPVPCRVAESVEWRYDLTSGEPDGTSDSAAGLSAGISALGDEVWVEIDGADAPEPVGAHGIDLGEALAQQLSVALDPFPRASGAMIETLDWHGDGQSEGSSGPFAALAQLRREE